MNNRRTVVIIGAGFGGLAAARALARAPVDVILIDRNNYHTFQPLLYQVATAALDPEEIGHAVRGIFHGQSNFSFRMGTVNGVDWGKQQIQLEDGDAIRFDYLILSAGAETHYYDIPGVAQYAFPLKSMEEAVDLRSHIMHLFEKAAAFPELIGRGILNFVVVGGGPTGVEMAGALSEWFHAVLRKDYPDLDITQAGVFLVEAQDHILPAFDKQLRANALAALHKRGVQVLLNKAVATASVDSVTLSGGTVIPTQTIIWSAGIKGNSLSRLLGLPLTRGDRVVVDAALSVPDHPGVFAIGDMAACQDAQGRLLPQVAQVAIQGARHVARQIDRFLIGQPAETFVYRDPGSMATIGRNAAVVQLANGLKLTGFIAWLAWLFLHLIYLIGFRNRLNVLINWTWNYLTYDRSPRLILNHRWKRG